MSKVPRVKQHTGQADVETARSQYASGRDADRYDNNWRSTNSLFQVDTRVEGADETFQLSLAVAQKVDITGTTSATIVLPTFSSGGSAFSLRVVAGAEVFTFDAGDGEVQYPEATAIDPLGAGLYTLYTDDGGDTWLVHQSGFGYAAPA